MGEGQAEPGPGRQVPQRRSHLINISGSCRCALIGVPCHLRMLSIFSTFDNMLKLTVSPQAKRAETDPGRGTPTRAHLQPPESRVSFFALVVQVLNTRQRIEPSSETIRADSQAWSCCFCGLVEPDCVCCCAELIEGHKHIHDDHDASRNLHNLCLTSCEHCQPFVFPKQPNTRFNAPRQLLQRQISVHWFGVNSQRTLRASLRDLGIHGFLFQLPCSDAGCVGP